ncbi:MAG: glycoside hydrolase family 31 protein [Paludibacter sp.]|nr:glycoside hydrolase family 31 protein [Paludibacter sp.]
MKYLFIFILSFFSFLLSAKQFEKIESGVYILRYGEEDIHTPLQYKEPALSESLKKIGEADNPFNEADIKVSVNSRGCVVELPLDKNENIYGFGLQMGSFRQNNLKRRPIVNDHPLKDLGYSHAPQPYYISSKGYCIVINTARYTTFYIGTNRRNNDFLNTDENQQTKLSTDELYKSNENKSSEVNIHVDIPGAKGISILVFSGPNMLSALKRYNLFAGGGSLPAIWGLGVKYRVKADSKQSDVARISNYFRENNIPCDVLGLEPKWQTRAYSCSYVWDKDNFPAPSEMIKQSAEKGFKLNLWEHAFTHPTSPIHEKLKNYSGDFLVWNGLVPDFTDVRARKIFADYHQETFVNEGISGFKLDECDNSNITRGDLNWSFPEITKFPSGIDGEKMHQLFGTLYQKTIYDIYKKNNLRTYLDVRASGPFTSSYSASLYSDTYDSLQYVQMINNSSLSGLLWSPEVRESKSRNEFFRRVQIAVLSAQTLFNSWYLKNPPWLQFDKNKNNIDEILPEAEQNETVVRQLLNFKMSIIPYLYTQFVNYRKEGIPPFRPLVLAYPNDTAVINIYDQYFIGDDVLACPVLGEKNDRIVYLPEGNWYNFNTNEKLEGGKKHKVIFRIDEIPIFIKEGTILPLALPVQYVNKETVFDIICNVYGKNIRPSSLFEDDGITYNFEKGIYNDVKLTWNKNKGKIERKGNYKEIRYRVKSWKKID